MVAPMVSMIWRVALVYLYTSWCLLWTNKLVNRNANWNDVKNIILDVLFLVSITLFKVHTTFTFLKIIQSPGKGLNQSKKNNLNLFFMLSNPKIEINWPKIGYVLLINLKSKKKFLLWSSCSNTQNSSPIPMYCHPHASSQSLLPGDFVTPGKEGKFFT